MPESGGFGGGPHPGQSAHLAPTYAVLNTLVTIGTPSALGVVDRPSLRRFLLRMKQPSGGFTMHDDGECDVRGAYTAVSVASITALLDAPLSSGVAEWIASCQTYEGGIGEKGREEKGREEKGREGKRGAQLLPLCSSAGATPGEEAHGGYTFCGLAALVLLGRVELLNLPRLAHWL